MRNYLAIILVAFTVHPAKGVSVATDNFIVDGATKELAQEVATQAESHRRIVATEWTGDEIPRWDTPCLIFVSIEEEFWGWTYYHKGDIRGITLRGSRKEILNYSLPHEITHAVLVSYFKGDPIPRWADEGIAVSSEKDCPHRLQGRWGTQPLRELFAVKKYPNDWELFYGQGFSVTAYLVETYDKPTFLKFISQGEKDGWEESCLKHFHIDLTDLESNWKLWHQEVFGLNVLHRERLWRPVKIKRPIPKFRDGHTK